MEDRGEEEDPVLHPPARGDDRIAGLYSWWKDRSKDDDDPHRWVLTATILTMDAVDSLRDIHDRTPVTLPRTWWDDWLDPAIEGDQPFVDAAIAAASVEAGELALHEVARLTGDDRAELVNPLQRSLTGTRRGSWMHQNGSSVSRSG